MGGEIPKQFLPLNGKTLACHSLEVLQSHPLIAQVIVVCAPVFHPYFSDYRVEFAEPGERRQDSLFNALQKVEHEWVCIHDAARPFLTAPSLASLIEEGMEGVKAATLGIPVKNTIKFCDQNQCVQNTPDRSLLWEIQTPQLLTKELLERGFAYANRHAITVTDDVSLAELLGHPVKVVLGSYKNIKITTPEDLTSYAQV